MIAIRRARPADAPGIGAVHVSAWRSAYPGVLPDTFLAKLSVARQAGHYDRAIRIGLGVHVAAVSGLAGPDTPPTASPIVGFTTARRNRAGALAEGEVETLYVLDDWRERGLGPPQLAATRPPRTPKGGRCAVGGGLRDNPASYFYQRLGGKRIAAGTTYVGGSEIPQVAYAWDPIELLLDVDA